MCTLHLYSMQGIIQRGGRGFPLHLYSMQGIIQRGGRGFPYLCQIYTSACMCIKSLINDPCFSHSLPPSVYGNTSSEQYSHYPPQNIVKAAVHATSLVSRLFKMAENKSLFCIAPWIS